nr:hypothetical protein [Tanacetum cinerariifolium]
MWRAIASKFGLLAGYTTTYCDIRLVLVHWIEIQTIKAPFEPESVTLISRLDLSDPLHLHPNDSTTMTIVSMKLKGTENYQIWYCAMMLALEGKNKTGFIDGSSRRSNVNEVLGRQWDRETYDKVDDSVTFNLHHKINSLCQNGSTLEDFKRNNQLMKLMQFLMGLDNSYMQIRSSILSRDPLPDVRGTYAIISSEESHRVVSSSNSRTSQRGNAQRYQTSGNTSRPSNVTRPSGNVSRRTNGGPQLVQLHTALIAAGVVVDSGANQHLTYTDKLLVNVIDISKLGIKVSHPNGTEAVITKDLKGMSVLGNGNQIYVLYYLNDSQGPYKVTSKEGLRFFLTIVDDYTRLPSPVLNGKSPFDLVFNMKPALKHLTVFGCLCFAIVLNGHDKFGSRVEKCVLVGYASFKKGYKLFSLERKQFVYSRDVKFFVKVFPFKIKQSTDTNLNSQGLDHVNFFNKIMHENLDTSNDVTSIPASSQSDGSHHPLHSNCPQSIEILEWMSCIHIVKQPKPSLEAFVDADWAKCIVTRKSVTGFCVKLNGFLVFLKSKKQNTLSKSSAEAEYRAIAFVTSEIVWILKILKDLNWEHLLHVNLFCDSQAAIKIAVNPVFHERTKHLEIDLHFVREKILSRVLKTKKINTADQTADIFTKGLDKLQHEKLVSPMGLFDCLEAKIKGGY